MVFETTRGAVTPTATLRVEGRDEGKAVHVVVIALGREQLLARRNGRRLRALLTGAIQQRADTTGGRHERTNGTRARAGAARIARMRSSALPKPGRIRHRGFTLLELMIALVVITILLAVALPSYQNSVRKGRRSDAITALNAIQQAQERSRSSFSTYCSELASAPTATTCGLSLGATSTSGYYGLAVSGNTATAYVATATAQGAQSSDTRCATMAVKIDRGNVSYGSSSTNVVDWTDANRCWAK